MSTDTKNTRFRYLNASTGTNFHLEVTKGASAQLSLLKANDIDIYVNIKNRTLQVGY